MIIQQVREFSSTARTDSFQTMSKQRCVQVMEHGFQKLHGLSVNVSKVWCMLYTSLRVKFTKLIYYYYDIV